MQTLGWILAVVFVLIAGVAWWRARNVSRDARERQSLLESQVDGQKQAVAASELKAADARSQMEIAQAELQEAIRLRDEKAVAKALWRLELDRTQRQWAEVAATDAPVASDDNTGVQLTNAISSEVGRLREEVGVAIEFTGAVDKNIDVEVALATLRITSEVLALGAKLADEITVGLNDTNTGVFVNIQCSGWDDAMQDANPSAAGESDAGVDLEAVAKNLNGTFKWEIVSTDVRRAVIQLPLDPTALLPSLDPAVDETSAVVAETQAEAIAADQQ